LLAFTGRLTRDPQTKYAPNGTAICEFGLAVGRKYGGTESVCFLDCVGFGKLAEIIGEYGTKGKLASLRGRLQMDSWEDKQTGQKRTKLKVVAEEFNFLGPRDPHPPERSQEPVPRQEDSVTDPPSTQGEADPVYDDDTGKECPF
jgi:single-strand DNA-binding protein